MASANSGAEEDYMNFQTLKGRDEKFLYGETDYDAVEESSRRPIPEPRDGSPVKKTKQGNDQARPMLAGILGDYKKIPPIILIVLVLLVVTLIATLACVLTKFQQYDAKLEAIGEITAPFKATSAAIVGKLQSNKDGTELLRGEKGDTGLKGAQGVMGASGNNGTDGADGMDGSPGEAGQKGDQGLQGQKGERGNNGASGMKGQKGQMGSTASVTHGGVYTRWGYTSCGSSSSRLYYGIIGSTGSDMTGGGVDFLCLPTNPEWLSTSTSPSYISWIGSVSYQVSGYIFSSSVDNKRAWCAKCYTNSRPAVMMIPGRSSCPTYWTREYYGYLMASQESLNHPSRYICVNNYPSYYSYSSSSYYQYSGYLTFVKADCSGNASLDECSSGEYVHGRVLSCVVCSR